MKKKSFVMYANWIDAFRCLPPEAVKTLIITSISAEIRSDIVIENETETDTEDVMYNTSEASSAKPNSKEADFERIMAIYAFAQDFMERTGNPNQWRHSHPAPDLIRSDIEKGIIHLLNGDPRTAYQWCKEM